MTEIRSAPQPTAKALQRFPGLEQLPPAVRPYAGALDLTLSADDGMYTGDDPHYYECGASALNVILAAQALAQVTAPKAILDFGAGAGRVTRWLRAAFPAATINACDLRPQDLDFCRSRFHATTWISGVDIEALRAPGTYDLIWVGSVLTHLSAEKSRKLIDKLLSWTNPGGILVMSTIGRVARARRDNGGSDYIDPHVWEEIKNEYAAIGFGYADYLGQSGYGLSLTKLSWTAALVESLPTARLILLSEGVWDTLHDIVAIQNSPSLGHAEGLAGLAAQPTASHDKAATEKLAAELFRRESEIAALKTRLEALESSRSWQLTGPLRNLMKVFRR